MQKRKLSHSEKIAHSFLKQYALRIDPLIPDMDGNRQTPDFFAEFKNGINAYIEVKHIDKPDHLDHGVTFRELHNKLTRDIDEAASQLISRAPANDEKRILLWICGDPDFYAMSLVDLLSLEVRADDGTLLYDIERKYLPSERIEKIKSFAVFLFVGMDGKEFRVLGIDRQAMTLFT